MSTVGLLVDGTNLAYRFSHNPNAHPYTAAIRFLSAIAAVGSPNCRPLVAWDAGRSWRYEVFPDYKSARRSVEVTPDILTRRKRRQNIIRLLRDVLPLVGVMQAEADGWEADDALAELVEQHRAARVPCLLLSSDRDLVQLLTRGAVSLIRPDQPTLTATSEVKDGVLASEWLQVRLLSGDDGDSLGGLPGFGPKRAVRLVREHGSAVGALTALRADAKSKAAWAKALRSPEGAATLRRNLLCMDLNLRARRELSYAPPRPDAAAAVAALAAVGLADSEAHNVVWNMSLHGWLKETA